MRYDFHTVECAVLIAQQQETETALDSIAEMMRAMLQACADQFAFYAAEHAAKADAAKADGRLMDEATSRSKAETNQVFVDRINSVLGGVE